MSRATPTFPIRYVTWDNGTRKNFVKGGQIQLQRSWCLTFTSPTASCTIHVLLAHITCIFVNKSDLCLGLEVVGTKQPYKTYFAELSHLVDCEKALYKHMDQFCQPHQTQIQYLIRIGDKIDLLASCLQGFPQQHQIKEDDLKTGLD